MSKRQPLSRQPQPQPPPPQSRELAIIREIRTFIAGAILFNQALAARLGINATDYQILNLLDLRGSATPGDIRRWTGLTSGGVTLVLDRLQTAGFIRRTRNASDRRSLIVECVPRRRRKVLALYKSIDRGMNHVFGACDARDLDAVLDFFKKCNALPRPQPRA